MNDEQWQELGRRAVACKGWRWMHGMLLRCDERIITSDGIGGTETSRLEFFTPSSWSSDLRLTQMSKDEMRWELPDLRDPATVGCLLALVREAWGDPAICIVEEHRDWWARLNGLPLCAFADTEAEALVAALEAAP